MHPICETLLNLFVIPKKEEASASSFLVHRKGLEPIYMPLSGGQWLPPVQKLVAIARNMPKANRKGSATCEGICFHHAFHQSIMVDK